ncbi:MAG: PSD1 and planctomycete cytochrome C domain-containing protein [Phycisphaeraceae bacterium]|nr:PSD1 and planctomycete cytochrome C domain-containing protein [Phycisphaeraceae bacterium]
MPTAPSTTQSWKRKGVLAWLVAAGCLGFASVLVLPEQGRQDNPLAPLIDVADKKAEKPISFNRDIRPILSDKCFACHGPDAAVAEGAGGFRLDVREGAIVPAEASGKAPIVPGDAEASEVINRVKTTKPNLVMPPASTHTTVTDDEVRLLERWINEGAEYEGHWAYQTPIKPEIPEIDGASEKWAQNNIDRFIAARLAYMGLMPSEQADKATLIRRVSLDLTGLPPTPEEIDTFLADESPDAYEKLVDRLLSSPHFGERLALIWLDAARYGDTNGFHHDNIRTAWPWRQWVIEAFNSNMPYDQFITEQLAGDLLPNATQQQILASGFCRMHNINDEGGALNDEYLVEAIADRIETIGTVLMAQTYTCARCHDHKYDPIPQEDYFATWAYFNSVEGERGVYRNDFTAARAYPPLMMWKSDELKAQLTELKPKLDATRAAHEKLKPAFEKKMADWQDELRKKVGIKWAKTTLKAASSSDKGTKVAVKPDRTAHLSGKAPGTEDITLTLTTEATDLRIVKLDALPVKVRRKELLGRATNGNVVLTHVTVTATAVKDPTQTQQVRVAHAWANHEQTDGDYDVLNTLKDDKLGWAVGAHQAGGPRTALFVTDKPFGFEGGTEVRVTLKHQSIHKQHSFAKVRVDLASGNENTQALTKGQKEFPLQPLALVERSLVPDAIYNQYFEAWLEAKAPADNEVAKRLAEQEAAYKKLEEQAVPVLIMKEAAKPVPAYILERGSYDKPIKDNPIPRKPPSMVDLPMPEGAPNNRLGFAQWLVQPEHPLTARVHVNRLWQMLFGVGIVKSVEDFGSQADWPSHPALLDYMAVKFVEIGWDQKALIKEVVTSATYRQQAARNQSADEVDADNRLLSYFPRQRLKAEFIRDQALFAAGLLNDEIGGPSVKPYQPGDLWNEVAIGGTNTGRFKRDSGKALYRRSMYTFWKKTSPPAQMQIFNAPTREFCVVGRDTTNTPLQVLTLWNDEQFLEASRALAQRTIAESGEDAKRLELIFRRCTGDAPNADELSVLQDVLAYYRERYASSVEDAKALLTQGEYPLPEKHDPAELASWMMVASTALSLDETIVRD